MPRIARIIAPGYPHHITQRGNNRTTVFFDDEDRQVYLEIRDTPHIIYCIREKLTLSSQPCQELHEL